MTSTGHSPEVLAARAQLNAEAALLVGELDQMGSPAYPDVSADEVRAFYRGMARFVASPAEVDEIFDWTAGSRASDPPGCPVRIYRQNSHAWGERRPLIVYLHSGGWAVGSLPASDERARRLAVATGAVVASVDYRLAPEHRFPAALDDAESATAGLMADGGGLLIDPDRLVLVGDSSGGNLAAAMTLRARADGRLAIAHQVLMYPVLAADRSGYPSYTTFGEGLPLTAVEMEWFEAQYLGSREHTMETAPLLAEDLSGLPSALVLVAGCDLLRDEGCAYAQRLDEAGVAVTLSQLDGTVHGFFAQSGALSAAARATELIAESMRRRFANSA